jgi:hypothetical protein
MDSISSITSSASAMVAKQTANLNKAVSDAKASFASTLSKVTPRPKTGFKSGATYEAGTLTGQTKAAFSSALTAIQSAVTIKPTTGIK